MSDKKRQKIYEALVEGAYHGLTDESLHKFTVERCPKTTKKNIVLASRLALEDPHVKDVNALQVIYALAINLRLEGRTGEATEENATPAESQGVTAH